MNYSHLYQKHRVSISDSSAENNYKFENILIYLADKPFVLFTNIYLS